MYVMRGILLNLIIERYHLINSSVNDDPLLFPSRTANLQHKIQQKVKRHETSSRTGMDSHINDDKVLKHILQLGMAQTATTSTWSTFKRDILNRTVYLGDAHTIIDTGVVPEHRSPQFDDLVDANGSLYAHRSLKHCSPK